MAALFVPYHRWHEEEPTLAKFGLGPEHIPELVRVFDDPRVDDPGDDNAWGACIAALVLLGELRAEAAIDPILGLMARYGDPDWIGELAPVALCRIGPAAIDPLVEFHLTVQCDRYMHWTAAEAIARIGREHPAERDRCVNAVCRILEAYRRLPLDSNGFLIGALVDLGARECLPLIKDLHDRRFVDESIRGTYDEVWRELDPENAPPAPAAARPPTVPRPGPLADSAEPYAQPVAPRPPEPQLWQRPATTGHGGKPKARRKKRRR